MSILNFPKWPPSICQQDAPRNIQFGTREQFSSREPYAMNERTLRPDYFISMMDYWMAAIPDKFLWLVEFECPSLLSQRLPWNLGNYNTSPGGGIRSLEHTGQDGNSDFGWFSTPHNFNVFDNDTFQTPELGCIFAQGINIPDEQAAVGFQSIQPGQNGFLPVYNMQGRRSPLELTIQFRETNFSFGDFIIRPWIIMASHYGLVARDTQDRDQLAKNIKTNVHISLFAKGSPRKVYNDQSQIDPEGEPDAPKVIMRKKFSFYNCVPTRMGTQDHSYEPTAEMYMHTVQFAYSHYTVTGPLAPAIGISQYLYDKVQERKANPNKTKEQQFRDRLKIIGRVRDCIDEVSKITKAGAGTINAFKNLKDQIKNAKSPRDVAKIINASQDFRRALGNLGVESPAGSVILDEADKTADSIKVLESSIKSAKAAVSK